MIKNLTKHGNSYALVIDRAILDLLNFEPDSPLEVTTDGKSLKISRAIPDSRSQRLANTLEKTNSKFGNALKKLAE